MATGDKDPSFFVRTDAGSLSIMGTGSNLPEGLGVAVQCELKEIHDLVLRQTRNPVAGPCSHRLLSCFRADDVEARITMASEPAIRSGCITG